jgi:hypothetical protein
MNVSVQCIAFRLHIRQVPASDLGLDAGYPDRFNVGFLCLSRQKVG